MEFREDLMNYKGGIYNSDSTCGNQLNHGLLLVGKKDDYYILKNSFGDSWGDNGYLYLKIGD